MDHHYLPGNRVAQSNIIEYQTGSEYVQHHNHNFESTNNNNNNSITDEVGLNSLNSHLNSTNIDDIHHLNNGNVNNDLCSINNSANLVNVSQLDELNSEHIHSLVTGDTRTLPPNAQHFHNHPPHITAADIPTPPATNTYVPYYNTNVQYADDQYPVVIQTQQSQYHQQQQQHQPNHNHNHNQYQQNQQYQQHQHPQQQHHHSHPQASQPQYSQQPHSLSLGAPVGLAGIHMDYYQRRANSIEVPPNVSLPMSTGQLRNMHSIDATPTSDQSIVLQHSHPQQLQIQSPLTQHSHPGMMTNMNNMNTINTVNNMNSPNTALGTGIPRIPGNQPMARQLLQGQDGASVPIDTSGMIKLKRWKIFPGRNRFFCDGRFVMAKEPAVFAFTIILLGGTFASFVYFDCPYLGSKVNWSIPICGILLFIFVVSTLLRTTFTDPGIIPRATPEEALAFEQFSSAGHPSPTYRPPPRTKEVTIRNQQVKLKYCFTCKILRPPRASHCSLCDNCVERFDHHCPWVGNCVGRRNYRYFYLFIVSLAFLTVYVFGSVVTHLTLLSNESSITDAIKASPASMIVAIICFFSMWSIIGLAGFHTYLILNNLTTNEDIKGSFSSKRSNSTKNPYTGSACENCVEILCSPLTPSLLKSRTYVYCDEQKYIARRRRKSNSSSAGDSPIPPPPLRSPYPLATPFQGPSSSLGAYPMEQHDHTSAQYLFQQHQRQQQAINRNSHSMQNMAGPFSGPTPPNIMRAQMQQHHRTLPASGNMNVGINNSEQSSRQRYDCSPLDSNSGANVFINQNINRLTNECVGGLGSNQMGVAYQHKSCGNSQVPGKHFSS